MSNSLRPHGVQPSRLLRPWDFPGKSTGVGCHCLLQHRLLNPHKLLSLRLVIIYSGTDPRSHSQGSCTSRQCPFGRVGQDVEHGRGRPGFSGGHGGVSLISLVSSTASDLRPPAFRSTLSPDSLWSSNTLLIFTLSVPLFPHCEVEVIVVHTSCDCGDSLST